MTTHLPTLCVTLCVCLGYAAANGDSWSYSTTGSDGPSKWGSLFQQHCSGSSQSPIDIKEGDVDSSKSFTAVTFENYNTNTGVVLEISNTGHSVKVAMSGQTSVQISNGDLPGTFRAVQYHFHWGSTSAQGSEHLVNHHAYPMELHIVHYNTKYSDIGVAIGHADGLAVIGFMFEVQESNNNNYNNIVSSLTQIRAAKEHVSLTPVAMDSLLPTTYASSAWFRYSGSLTTPSCNEVVTWTVMRDSIKISEAQLSAFRQVFDSHSAPLVDNYRPVQELNSRVVYANYKPDLHWGYTTHVSATHWQDYYGACGGDSQSPIDIPKFAATPDDHMGDFVFTGYDSTDGVSMNFLNNGHTAQVKILSGEMTVSGGGLPKVYKVLQCHFHWGSSGNMGSEHLVQGKAYPMELHIVHYNTDMTVSQAVTSAGGLAVLGFFFEETESDNPKYASIVQALGSIRNKDTNVSLPAMRLDSLLPAAEHLNHFYRYDGSLTTPGCFQSVTWTVFPRTIPISRAQLTAFRNLMSAEKDQQNLPLKLVNNFRPPQQLNNRQVKVAVPKWTYSGHHGPSALHWGDYYPYCKDDAGSRQSPINIDPTTISLDVSLKSFSFTKWNQPYQMTLKNTGHSVNVNLITPGVMTSGGGLGDTYELVQFHFHWGSDSSKGSEHLIDNDAHPMEVHFVHYNTKYGSIGNALTKPDGLAVLGFLFEIGDTDNAALEPIVSKLSGIVNPDDQVAIDGLVSNSFLPSGLHDYYRYQGSLTTPGCYESVTWTLFRETIVISEKQMRMFRILKSHEKDENNNHMAMVDNFRPVQKRHSRQVKATFLIGGGVSTSHCLVTMVMCAAAFIFHQSA